MILQPGRWTYDGGPCPLFADLLTSDPLADVGGAIAKHDPFLKLEVAKNPNYRSISQDQTGKV